MIKTSKNSRLFKYGLIGAGLLGLGLAGKKIYNEKKEGTDQSFQSWFLEHIFSIFSYPLKRIESKRFYDKALQTIEDKREEYIEVPELDGIKTTEVYLEGMQILLFNDKKDRNQQVIFFLYGGAYIFQPVRPHFNSIKEIIRQTDAKVVMPIYPKAPKYNFRDAYPKVLKAYRETVLKTASSKNITFIGDSAGGGLALGVSHLLAKENLSQPSQLILVSPWLDAGSENPSMEKYEESDTVLPSQFYFQETGHLWAQEEDDVYHPLVSPLYTDQLKQLPPIYIITGGDEMVYPDILRFKTLMENEGIEVHLHIEEEMVHDYAIFNTPEGKKARKLISKRILAVE